MLRRGSRRKRLATKHCQGTGTHFNSKQNKVIAKLPTFAVHANQVFEFLPTFELLERLPTVFAEVP
jgi:hypothetical protein